MTKENFEIALDFLFPTEGGYTNNKYDKGGATNMGITQYTYDAYKKKLGLPTKDVKNITKEEAKDIYFNDYWKSSGADKISDPNMAVVLFDTAVLHGPATAQHYYNLSKGNIDEFLEIRKQSYDKIISNDPSQKIFYNGWNNRVNNLKNNIKSNKFNQQKEKFTPEKIGKMSRNKYLQNEAQILEQYKNGEIKYQTPINDFSNYTNPISGINRVFTREDIDKMSIDEFTKYQQEIFAQSQSIGVPYKDSISKNTRTYTKDKNYFSPANGKWRTIDGNHVFIENN